MEETQTQLKQWRKWISATLSLSSSFMEFFSLSPVVFNLNIYVVANFGWMCPNAKCWVCA
jgi:hypothetical protein